MAHLNTGNQTLIPPPKNNDSISPVSPTSPVGGVRATTPNFSRPGAAPATQNCPSQAPPPVPTQSQTQPEAQPHASKGQSLGSALKGLHGAGEALRGAVNSTIAKGMHDSAEEEKMRALRKQGMSDFRGSRLYEKSGGLREGFRAKAEVAQGRRLRKRSLSRGPQLGHGLDVVDERPTP